MLLDDSTRRQLWRLLASTAVGLAMAGTTYVCAFLELRQETGRPRSHEAAFHALGLLKDALESFHKENGSYPESLAELKDKVAFLEFEPSGELLDPWHHSYQYASQGESYTLLSLGYDGQPGGVGLATDVDARAVTGKDGAYEFPNLGAPTLWQYTFDCDTRPIKNVCVLSGIFAFVACLVSLRNEQVHVVTRVTRLVTTLAACLFVTLILNLLHLASKHH